MVGRFARRSPTSRTTYSSSNARRGSSLGSNGCARTGSQQSWSICGCRTARGSRPSNRSAGRRRTFRSSSSDPRTTRTSPGKPSRSVQDYVQQDRLDSYTLPRALKRIIERKAAEETLFFEQQRAEVTPQLNRRRRAQHRCPAFLPAQQCAGGQGSYFNRPLVAEQFARLLDTACRTCSSSNRLRRSARRRR